MKGFTLIEVLVALVVISIGLYGVAAMQASALSSTHGSRQESLVALEARSLADAMLANPGYWHAGSFPAAPFTISASSSNPLSSTVDCRTASCTPPQLAAYDVRQWGTQLQTQIPGASAIITCQAATPTTTPPNTANCQIQLSWTQKATVAISKGTTSTQPATTQNFTLVNQL